MEKSLSDLEELKGVRNIVVSSFYTTVGFWLCSSPVGFYCLIIAVINRLEFPTSYLINHSIVIIANFNAVVNPIVTILCFRSIKESAKEYLGLGNKKALQHKELLKALRQRMTKTMWNFWLSLLGVHFGGLDTFCRREQISRSGKRCKGATNLNDKCCSLRRYFLKILDRDLDSQT